MKPKLLPRGLRAALTVALAALPLAAAAQGNACGELANAYGPFDYRVDRGEPLRLVDGAHFSMAVEMGIHGVTATRPGQDMDYTLRAFPNHHRALIAVMRLGEKEKTTQPSGMRYTVDCWFDRALRWKPDDSIARMIYVEHLIRTKRPDEARPHLAYVVANAKDQGSTYYHAGLLYTELKDWPKALEAAHRALEFGYQRTDLRDKLVAAGQWTEPAAPVAGSPASAASSPPS